MSRKPVAEDNPSSISSTLLQRVQARRPEAWDRLVRLYSPVIYRWCRRAGLQADDAADVLQDTLSAVFKHVAGFRREDTSDSFTAWLATITRNKIRDFYRRRHGRPEARGGSTALAELAEVPEAASTDEVVQPDAASSNLLSHQALDLIRAEFENRTWSAFWQTSVDGLPPAQVADELGMSVAAVYMAKSRVIRRLRQELRELVE